MGAEIAKPGFEEPPRCRVCGDVIGVYERLVEVAEGRVRRTSRAAEPGSCRSGGACFHLGCYPHPLDVLAD